MTVLGVYSELLLNVKFEVFLISGKQQSFVSVYEVLKFWVQFLE